MIDNTTSEQLGQRVEQKTTRLLYRPEAARKSLRKYFINEGVIGIIKDKKIVQEFLDGKNPEPKAKIERISDKNGRRVLTPESKKLFLEFRKEDKFVQLVRRYHSEIINDLELKGELLKDHQGKFLDSLSIGILYKLSQEPEFAGLVGVGSANFPELMKSEQYKIAKTTTLLSLAESSLERFDNPNNDDEINKFSRYVRRRAEKFADLPTTNEGWKNLFIKNLEDNPTEFLEDYFIHFRFSEDEIENSRNTFKLGEIIAEKVVEAGREPLSKTKEIDDFFKYEEKERTFGSQEKSFFEKRFWQKQLIDEVNTPDVKQALEQSIHGKKLAMTDQEGKKYDRHRSEQTLLDRGILKTNANGELIADNDFFKTFSQFYQNEEGKPMTENQMVLGMLYSMRGELGVGVLSRGEVLKRAQQIIPTLEKAANDLVLTHLGDNFGEYAKDLAYYASKGMLGKDIKAEYTKIKETEGMAGLEYLLISKYSGEFIRRLVNIRYVDGFEIGEKLGGILKKNASEKNTLDKENLTKLDVQTGDENAAMALLIEGKEITDPGIRDRVERTMDKTSHLRNAINYLANSAVGRGATKFKVGFQNVMFYHEGDSPFATKPNLLGKGKSVGLALFDAAVSGHLYNYLFGDPVNRGYQGLIIMGDYFIRDEVMPIRRELKARKNEIRTGILRDLGLKKTNENEAWYIRHNPLTKGNKDYRKKYREVMGSYINPLAKNNRLLRKLVNKEVKPFRQELNKKFWHNKGKLFYSYASYGLTSAVVNYALHRVGLTGQDAWLQLMAVNTLTSSLLSGAGFRSGAEFIVNWLESKKAVDGTMALLTDKNVGVERAQPVQQKPEFHFKTKILDVPYTFIKKKGVAIATNIAPRIEKTVKKIKYVGEVMERHERENRQLQILEKFVNGREDQTEKFSKEELIDAVEFLSNMKEEQSLLMIHNSRYYEKRMIRKPDGSFVEIDNRKGLENIDRTRREILEYAQANLPYEEYHGKNFDKPEDKRTDEDRGVEEAALDFFSDVKTIRKKVFYRRMKYLVASYGYRVTFMVMSHALQSQGGLLEQPMNEIFGNATMDYQHIIEQAPTTVFHANTETPKGQEALAKEIWARAEEINNLVHLMGTSEQLSEFQPGLESQLAYYGVNQTQLELLVNNLKVDPNNLNNLNTADLMRFIYVLSSYKEGQEYLATLGGFEGTERRNLAPMITNIAVDPIGFMNRAMADKENAAIMLLKYPDIAQKLGIKPESLADQLGPLVIPQEVKEQMLANNGSSPITISNVGPQVIKVGDVVAEFVDGLTSTNRESKIDLLTQLNNIYRSDSSMVQQAMNHHFDSFLAESHNLVGTDLTNKSINNLPIDSMIYKMYQAFGENGQVVPLLNRAKDGDVNAYNQLYALLEAKYPNDVSFYYGVRVESNHSIVRDQIIESQANTEIYDKVLNNLPGDEALRKEEIVRRIQQEMIGLGLRPVSAPVMDLDEMVNLAKNPDIFTDPRTALMYALSPGSSDLEMAVALTGNKETIFVQNNLPVGRFSSIFQPRTTFDADALGMINAVEGAESENNQLSFPKMIWRNIGYAVGWNETASGATTPAGSLIEMMTGPFGHGAMNPEAPAALHNYDAYGPGYLAKLLIAHFRGRVPDELLAQMGPDADLTQSIYDKDPSAIDRLCNKLETWIAADALVEKFGENKVHEVYLNHFIAGTVDGIQVKGADGAAQILFSKTFNELTPGEQFLIVALGQQPNEYLYDIKLDENGEFIGMEANPTKAITHALWIIENEKAGPKLEQYLGLEKKERILEDLHNMQDRVENEGWKKVFEGELHLPAEEQNFAATPDAARFTGMTDEQITEAIKNGEIKGVTFTNDGIRVIELNNIMVEETSRAIPEGLMEPQVLTGEQGLDGQLAAQMGGFMTDAKREGNFFVTTSGIRVPVVEAGNEVVVPGLAIIEVGPDGAISTFDKTGMLATGPQLIGSAYKPMEAYLLMKLYPDKNLGALDLNAKSDYYQEQLITNSTLTIDNMGTMHLNEALANSANVPMVELWTRLRVEDPDIWFKYQALAKEQFGIYFYEIKEGKFVEIKTDPFIGNAALAVGNIFVGGATAQDSGMIQMAEVYQQIGKESVKGDSAAQYVIEALNNPEHKNVNVWGQDLIDNAFKPTTGDSLIAIKTGSQQGFDPVTGAPMAIRNVVAVVKIDPDGKVTSTFLETTGIDASGKPVELGWGSEFIPVARSVIENSENKISPELAQNALNQLFMSSEAGQKYEIGAIDATQLYPFLKSLSNEEQYAYLREAIRSGSTKYIFVDLIGAPIDGDVQSVGIHFIDKNGVDKLITLNVSANLIESAGPLVNHFSDTSSQTTIVDILTQATQSEPEKYGGLLAQLQGQGINFVPIHDYEASPALFAIHELMEKRGMLFTGAEDTGAIMKQLGLDPKTTVFVNDELFRALNQENQNIIKEQLFTQREYLAMAAIYESSGLPGALDNLIYDKDMTSNPSYQLLKIFAETKTSQIFKPVDGERQFLLNQFQNLISNPEKAKELAPDVIDAYNSYNLMTDSIARGVPPTQAQAQAFIDALNRFDETTQERTLLSLGIGITPSAQSSTPLPSSILSYNSPQPMLAGVSLEAIQTSSTTAMELVNNFIKHPEKFEIQENKIIKAKEVTEVAIAIVDVINSPETKLIQNNELKIEHIVKTLADRGYAVDDQLVSQLVKRKQCIGGNLVINRILVNEAVPGFVNMESFKVESAKGYAGPLIQKITEYLRMNPNSNFVGLEANNDTLHLEAVDQISKFNPGDSVVIYLPWMGKDDLTNPGHIAQVLFTGKNEDGSPYMLVFDTNGDEKGTTAIRKIEDLTDFISQEAKDAKQYFPGTEPIFVKINPAEQLVTNP